MEPYSDCSLVRRINVFEATKSTRVAIMKIPWARWLINNRLLWRLGSPRSGTSMVGRGSCQVANFLLCPHMAEGRKRASSLLSLLIRALTPFRRAPSS